MLLFLLPVIFMSVRPGPGPRSFWEVYSMAFIWVGVFYASYYCTTDPTTGRRGAPARFIIQITAIATLAVAAMLISRHHLAPPLQPGAPLRSLPPAGLNPAMMHNIMVILLTIGLGQAIKFIYLSYRTEQERREFQAREREAELTHLKAQLKPHFLFNSLNTIYALIDIDPGKARSATHNLSKLLRYTLCDTTATVTLSDEIEFTSNYISLMRLRLPDHTQVTARVDTGAWGSSLMAPMIFINIVENAFKHGTISPLHGPIHITITADVHGTVTCLTANPWHPVAPQAHAPASGIGLANLRRRLSLLYPSRHTLDTRIEGNRFITTLAIDISRPPVQSDTVNIND